MTSMCLHMQIPKTIALRSLLHVWGGPHFSKRGVAMASRALLHAFSLPLKRSNLIMIFDNFFAFLSNKTSILAPWPKSIVLSVRQ